jgi:hypothetical protein
MYMQSQRDREEAETDPVYEAKCWNKWKRRYHPIGTSGGPCLGCSTTFEAIKEEDGKRYIQTSWMSGAETRHLTAEPCLLPHWMPAGLVKASLVKLREHLQAALDECQDQWEESDISMDSQNGEIDDPARSSPREGLLKRKRTDSPSDAVIEARRPRPSVSP